MNIGIDLGTTNTVVSYIDEYNFLQRLEFEENGSAEDNTMLPSCIAVCGDEIKVGMAAIDDSLENFDNFICDSKYYMGEKMLFQRAGKPFTPIDVAYEILKEVKRVLQEKFPNETEFNAFVTVPARFSDAARTQTIQALERAQFAVPNSKRKLSDEPVAAAIAYSKELEGVSRIMVVDFGGGTFDLSIVETNAVGIMAGMNNLKVSGWGGDLRLGGNDVDNLIIEKMIQSCGENIDLNALFHTPEIQRAIALLKLQTLEIKKQLYSDFTSSANVFIPDFLHGKDLEFELSPDDYTNMMSDIIIKYEECIRATLAQGKYKCDDIDKILIVGGMAHEPCLKKVILNMFNNDDRKLIIPDNSMYLVSMGAAIWNNNSELHVENRIYSSLGILLNNGKSVEPIVKEGSLLDDTAKTFSKTLYLSDDDADDFPLIVVEYNGEFIPKKGMYNIILEKTINLSSNNKTANIWNAEISEIFKNKKKFGKKYVTVDITIDADKMFTIKVKQTGQKAEIISLRLNS